MAGLSYVSIEKTLKTDVVWQTTLAFVIIFLDY